MNKEERRELMTVLGEINQKLGHLEDGIDLLVDVLLGDEHHSDTCIECWEELQVLGGILCDNDNLAIAMEKVETQAFHREEPRIIFNAMWELFDINHPCDLVSLTDHLRRRDELEEIGGAGTLAELVDIYEGEDAFLTGVAAMVARGGNNE